MDIVRYLLALAVIIAHVNTLAGFDVPFPISSFEGVGGFFALSGFLMYPNYTRHGNFMTYTRQRAQRILPPYFFIIVLSAVTLCVFSTLSVRDYFCSKGLYEYLGANITFLNWLHPGLPGVFEGDGYVNSAVNGSLWTMKVEWCLYFSVPIFVWLLGRIPRVRPQWLAFAIIMLSIAYRYGFNLVYVATGKEIFNILSRQIFGQLAFFYCGMLIWIFRDYFIRYIVWILPLGAVLVFMRDLIGEWSTLAVYTIDPIAISIFVLSISLFPKDIKILRHKRNISYEMYLFHYPIIQVGVWLGVGALGVWTEFGYVLISTVILSLASNLFVGKIFTRTHLKKA